MDDFDRLDDWLRSALAILEPRVRTTLFRKIGLELRRRNRARIANQVGANNTPWKPRKLDGRGRVRSTAKMLQGFRDLRRMALNSDASGFSLGFGGFGARLAEVHHFGLVDSVQPGGPRVKYAARPLIDLPDDDVAYVRQALIDELTK